MKALEIVRTAALVLLAVTAAWIATHGIAFEVHHSGGVVLSCMPPFDCPGVPRP